MYPSPTEAWLFREASEETVEDTLNQVIDDFLTQDALGNRNVWLHSYFGSDYPTNSRMSEYLSDIRSKIHLDHMISACECSQCGRLYIQSKPDINQYICYEPHNGEYQGILDSDA